MRHRRPHDSQRQGSHCNVAQRDDSQRDATSRSAAGGPESAAALDERAVAAARAELRGERTGILGATGRLSLPRLAPPRRVPERWTFIQGAGVDCGMLLVRVFVDTGLCAPFDPRPYPPDWHLHRAEEKYLGFVFDRAHEVFLTGPLSISPPQAGERDASGAASRKTGVGGASGDDLKSPPPLAGEGGEGAGVQPGDVAVFRFGRCYSHGGIVVEIDPLAIVHAYAPARCVIEERVHQNAVLSDAIRKPRFFSPWRHPATRRADFGLARGKMRAGEK